MNRGEFSYSIFFPAAVVRYSTSIGSTKSDRCLIVVVAVWLFLWGDIINRKGLLETMENIKMLVNLEMEGVFAKKN